MDCGGCGGQNRDDAAFCASCGSPLSLRCSSCARELAADARFCDGCGTPVPASGPGPGAVRKTVTAMFCDLGGSTGFGERVDAESARTVIGRYHALLQEVVDAYGGTVAKFIGDGMLAFFGLPEVAEDDAERAVAAAAEMQRRFGAFAAEVADRHGEALTFRIGVNSGEVVIGQDDADIVGDALNVAARLEKACEPGRVVVGEATWRLTRGAYRFEPLGDVEVAGRAEPVSAYVVVDDLAERSEEATPFVGRDGELSRLRATLEDAVAILGGLRALVDDPAVVQGHLERLRRRDLVEPTGSYWGDDPQYRFHHVLIRDAVYGRLLKETRADLHERIGEWTEEAAARVVGEYGPAIAHHYEQAHEYLAQLGALDDHGRALGRGPEAEKLAAEAAGSAGQGLKAAIAWRSVRARLLAAADDPQGAVALAEEAVALAQDTDLLLDHADAWAALADVRVVAGDEPGATAAWRARARTPPGSPRRSSSRATLRADGRDCPGRSLRLERSF